MSQSKLKELKKIQSPLARESAPILDLDLDKLVSAFTKEQLALIFGDNGELPNDRGGFAKALLNSAFGGSWDWQLEIKEFKNTLFLCGRLIVNEPKLLLMGASGTVAVRDVIIEFEPGLQLDELSDILLIKAVRLLGFDI